MQWHCANVARTSLVQQIALHCLNVRILSETLFQIFSHVKKIHSLFISSIKQCQWFCLICLIRIVIFKVLHIFSHKNLKRSNEMGLHKGKQIVSKTIHLHLYPISIVFSNVLYHLQFISFWKYCRFLIWFHKLSTRLHVYTYFDF